MIRHGSGWINNEVGPFAKGWIFKLWVEYAHIWTEDAKTWAYPEAGGPFPRPSALIAENAIANAELYTN